MANSIVACEPTTPSSTANSVSRAECIETTTRSTTPSQSEQTHIVPSRPLRALFVITSMPVGGAETLLVNMMRRFRTDSIVPEVACLKEPGPLGEQIASEFRVTSGWLRGKYDLGIVSRLARHLRQESMDAVITVGAGDKMFWGRLAARWAGVPVILSALHSTGWPDGIGRLNRILTPITDSFIAVAKPHGQFLVQFERFPSDKVVVIPNGVDVDRFQPNATARDELRNELKLHPQTNLVGIVAALRPEKNHALFLEAAALVLAKRPRAHFVIVGDGPERADIESKIASLGLQSHVSMLGTRSDTPRIVAGLDVFALTSHMEASPVSILEALACGVPVVATRVGSVSESVHDGWSGFTVEPGNAQATADALVQLLSNRELAETMGSNGRQHVQQFASLDSMVSAYDDLIHRLHMEKTTS